MSVCEGMIADINNVKVLNIYEKMSAITAELNAVAKNLRVGEGKNQYKAVGEADVLTAVKPLEEKYKVYSYPVERKVIDNAILTTKKTYQGNETETTKFFMRVETTYRFVNIEMPAEYLDIKTYGDGLDAGDKAPGKAVTYADKYALLKAYKIITGDDPDQKASEEEKATVKKFTKADIDKLEQLALRKGVTMKQVAKKYNLSSLAAITPEQYADAVKCLNELNDKA